MKRFATFLLALFVSIPGSTVTANADQNVPNIVPIPQQWNWEESNTDLTSFSTIILGDGSDAADQFTANQIANFFSVRQSAELSIAKEANASSTNGAIIIGNPDVSPMISEAIGDIQWTAEMDSEGYVLKLSDSTIVIAGKTAAGRFYGAMSLKQLSAGLDSELQHLTVIDYPQMKFRGVSDDISRGEVSTLENFKQIIRFLAEYKMNTYMPYLEDMIQLEKYPSIGEGRGALSKDEIIEIQDYAEQYHVQIIPVFQTLGHYENILNMDKFVKYAEFPGASSLNTQSEESFEFLESMLEEVVPLFRSKYFHMGADESWDVGRGASGRAVNRYDIATVHAKHYRKVYDILKKHGKEVMMYGDIVLQNPTILNQIPDDIIMMDWHYYATDNYPSTEVFEKANQPFIVSAGIQNWRKMYPDQTAAWLNIYNLTLEGYRSGAMGSVTSNWGDFGGPNLREMNYRGYAYAGECAWSPARADEKTINDRFDYVYYGSNDPRLHALENLMTRIAQDADLRVVFQPPMLATHDNPHRLLMRSYDIQKDATTILRLVDELQPIVPMNPSHLDYHRFLARFYTWYAEADEFAEWMDNTSREYIEPERRKPYTDRGIEWGQQLSKMAADLSREYESLWLRTNVEANLSRILDLFTYKKASIDNMVSALQNNRWSVSTLLSSDFIAANGASKDHPISSTALRKSFTLPKKSIDKAYLQLVGDSDVNLWLNGEKIGRVIATRTLSLWVHNQRVKHWDVTNLLHRGKLNVLAAEAKNYQGSRPASANIYLEIHYKDGSVEKIQTDQYWKSNRHPEDGWQSMDYDDRYWLPVTVVDYPWKVYAPMFEKGLGSRIEL